MPSSDSWDAALDAVWRCMIELAESGNDRVIAAQRRPSARHAAQIATIAADHARLAQAAEVLARRRHGQR